MSSFWRLRTMAFLRMKRTGCDEKKIATLKRNIRAQLHTYESQHDIQLVSIESYYFSYFIFHYCSFYFRRMTHFFRLLLYWFAMALDKFYSFTYCYGGCITAILLCYEWFYVLLQNGTFLPVHFNVSFFYGICANS